MVDGGGGALVVRSKVEHRSNYQDYREELRYDFWFSCAYCSIAETEAQGIRLEIDHYLPIQRHPNLAAEYDNLMWSCHICNRYKGDFEATETLRSKGVYVIRVDQEDPRAHLVAEGDRLLSQTTTGQFNIEQLQLNRQELGRLRLLRRRWRATGEMTAHGLRVLGAARDSLDEVRPGERGYVLKLRQAALERWEELSTRIEKHLRFVLQSPLVDRDPQRRTGPRRRIEFLKQIGAILPSSGSHPSQKPRSKRRGRRRKK